MKKIIQRNKKNLLNIVKHFSNSDRNKTIIQNYIII